MEILRYPGGHKSAEFSYRFNSARKHAFFLLTEVQASELFDKLYTRGDVASKGFFALILERETFELLLEMPSSHSSTHL